MGTTASTVRPCRRCRNLISIDSENIMQENVHCGGNEETYTLLYVKCPKCGEIVALQIDNNATSGIKENLLKIIRKGYANVVLTEKEKKKVVSLNNSLENKRRALREWAEDKDFYTDDGNLLVKCLTFSED